MDLNFSVFEFLDPNIAAPKLKIVKKLIQKKLGFRTLMDVIPLDATLVKGSHGRTDMPEELAPVIIAQNDLNISAPEIPCQQLHAIIAGHLK